jgi:hypothetical protein
MIKKGLEDMGAKVFAYDARYSNTTKDKILMKKARLFAHESIKRYYEGVFRDIEHLEIDYLFLVDALTCPVWFIQKLHRLKPDMEVITYNWDSIANQKELLRISNEAHKKFSFDPDDCEKYGYTFRPTFFDPDYEAAAGDYPKTSDLFFVGTAHNDRYRILETLKKSGFKTDFYYYLQSKLQFFYYKYIQRSYPKSANPQDFNYEGLTKAQVIERMKHAEAVVDIQHAGQTGLTLRPFETLGMKKKLVTTSATVKNYGFYNEKNILIIDRENPVIPPEFLKEKYEEIPAEIYNKYTLEAFLKDIFK